MDKRKLKISYRIDKKVSETLDVRLGMAAQDEGFEIEPYATGFNHQTGERDLVFDEQIKTAEEKCTCGDCPSCLEDKSIKQEIK